MAITLADFTKIWASTSPLTPYSFSESNYKEGWNFIGGTPPSRQMWDSIQNQNDEKLKYIVDNFLPLSGGTMTGNLDVNGTLKQNNENVLTSSFITTIVVSVTGTISANSWADFTGNITYPTGYSHALSIREINLVSPANQTLIDWRLNDTNVTIRLFSKTAYSNQSFNVYIVVTK